MNYQKRKFIRKKNKAKKTQNKGFNLTWNFLKEKFLTSVIAKITAGIITLIIGIGSWFYYQNVTNPEIEFTIQGHVYQVTTDDEIIPLEGVLISIVNQNIKTRTDKNGYFNLKIPTRRNNQFVELICSKDNFYHREKNVPVPLTKPLRSNTRFHLKHKHIFQSDLVTSVN